MATSKAQVKAVRKYEAEHYRKITVMLPRELEEAFRKAAGKSANGYIVDLIKKDLQA